MPIVFVHGVAVRRPDDPDFEQVSRVTQGAEWAGVQQRLRRFVAPMLQPHTPEQVHIQEIYWGDLGARVGVSEPTTPPAPQLLSVASRADVLEDRLRPVLPTRQWPELTRVAWQVAAAFPAETSWESLHSEMLRQLYQASAEMVRELRHKLGERVTEKLPRMPDWRGLAGHQRPALPRPMGLLPTHPRLATLPIRLSQAPTIGTLQEHLALSALSANPAVMSRHGVRRALSSVRQPIESFVPIFLGDVMTYLTQRGTPTAPGKIPLRVLRGLQEAQAAAPDEPLIVLTHSMGGQIMYDLLTAFMPVLAPTVKVDFWCACGSQVGLFKELKLFLDDFLDDFNAASEPALERQVGYFWNVWSYADLLSFPARGRVAGVHETAFAQTTNSLRGDHLGYLSNDVFYELLALKASLSLKQRQETT